MNAAARGRGESVEGRRGGARTYYGAALSQSGAGSGAADSGRLVDIVDAPNLRERDGVEYGVLADPSEEKGVLGPDYPSGLPQAEISETGQVLESISETGQVLESGMQSCESGQCKVVDDSGQKRRLMCGTPPFCHQ